LSGGNLTCINRAPDDGDTKTNEAAGDVIASRFFLSANAISVSCVRERAYNRRRSIQRSTIEKTESVNQVAKATALFRHRQADIHGAQNNLRAKRHHGRRATRPMDPPNM
jgi:hypothetical protein